MKKNFIALLTTVLFVVNLFTSNMQAQSLTNIHNGPLGVSATFQNKLYFFSDGANGEGLYSLDASDNVQFVKTIIGQTSKFVESGGKLFFTADDGSNGVELWSSDGTPGGTGMVKDIAANFESAFDAGTFYATSYQGKCYFVANDGVNGNELWVSNGTDGGTTMVKNIAGGDTSGVTAYGDPLLTVYRNKLYFFANSATGFDDELWETDGTGANTVASQSFMSSHYRMMVYKDSLWMQMTENTNYTYQIYVFDGTTMDHLNADFTWQNLEWVTDYFGNPIEFYGGILLGSSVRPHVDSAVYYVWNSSNHFVLPIGVTTRISEAAIAGGKLFFYNRVDNKVYVFTDPFTPTLALVPISSPYDIGLVEVNGLACFQREDSHGMEPWTSDGTISGTQRLELVQGSGSSLSYSSAWNVFRYHGNLYFCANFGMSNVWRTDGTLGGTVCVSSSLDTLYGGWFTEYNNCLYLDGTRTGFYTDNETYKLCDGLSAIEPIAEDILIYPNPATDVITITTIGNTEMRVYDTQGSLVKTYGPGSQHLDISDLQPGVYLAEIMSEGRKGKVRFVKM